MSKIGTGVRLAAALAVAVSLGTGCSASRTPSPSEIATTLPGPGQTPDTPGPSGLGARLVVLGDGVGGEPGLWTLDSRSHWTALEAAPGATALSRTTEGVAVVTGRRVDSRAVSDLLHPGRVQTLRWPGISPDAPVAGLDTSPAGKRAVVAADGQGFVYGVAAEDGTVTALSPAPAQSFAPLVAWLDDSRLLVLDADKFEISRLGVVDTSANDISLAQALAGVRVFALSQDRQVIAAATETAIFAGPVETFLGRTSPQEVVTLGDAQVAWARALDATGSQFFLMSGTVAPDGSVNSIREIGYSRQSSGWAKVLDTAVPFQCAIGQVLLG